MENIWQFIFWAILVYVFFLFLKFYIKNRKTEHEFTSIINHTFRTPLTRISWISKELERIDLSGDEKNIYIQNLNNATNKLLKIVDLIVGAKNIKDKDRYFWTETSFRDIVENSILKYREDINKKNIIFRISSFQEIPLLVLDIDKITFTIDTIIENSIIYTPIGGKIIIDCIIKSKNKLLFYVADTGMGLNFYDKIKIFSKYYRSKRATFSHPDGMGLCLYLSRKIIKFHNGKIYAKSKGLDKGSVFFIELPLNK
jgi:signal transduction histidine kinase